MANGHDDAQNRDDPERAAASAGLAYVNDNEPGFSRQRARRGFSYRDVDGRLIKDAKTLTSIRKLAIPPAWTSVWICAQANGHIQAIGRDARGRKQYRYHPTFRQIRDTNKFEHMLPFARALPHIRKAVAAHMALKGLPREKVLGSIVQLLESTLIRVGNDEYAKGNRSFGLTTLRNRHVNVDGGVLRFNFSGKGGKTWRLDVNNRRVAKVVRACQELPGQRLFQYCDEQGAPREITSSDVNNYLREVSGRDITAKDFRTWHGTVCAAVTLHELGDGDHSKSILKEAIARVAAKLGNTPTICRKCYVHPAIIESFETGKLSLRFGKNGTSAAIDLRAEERAVLHFLERRLRRNLKDRLRASLAAERKSRPRHAGRMMKQTRRTNDQVAA